MFLEEKFDSKYNGFYRAQVVEFGDDPKVFNPDIENGIYKVRVYPFMAELDVEYLPYAQSNLTTRYRHINLRVDDWVWVFFENGDVHYPIIFDLCNTKLNYPTVELPETEYGSYSKFSFNDKVKIEFDEDLGILKINTENNSILIEDYTKDSTTVNKTTITNGDNVLTMDNKTTAKKVSIVNKDNSIIMDMTGSSEKINIIDKNNNKIDMTSDGILLTGKGLNAKTVAIKSDAVYINGSHLKVT